MDPLEFAGRRPRLAALLGAICIAFSGIFFKFSGTSPSTVTFFRCLYALPWLAGLLIIERRRFGPLPRRELWLGLALASHGEARSRALDRAADLNPLATQIRQLRGS